MEKEPRKTLLECLAVGGLATRSFLPATGKGYMHTTGDILFSDVVVRLDYFLAPGAPTAVCSAGIQRINQKTGEYIWEKHITSWRTGVAGGHDQCADECRDLLRRMVADAQKLGWLAPPQIEYKEERDAD